MGSKVRINRKTSDPERKNSPSQTSMINSHHSTNFPMDNILYLQRTVGNQAVEKLFKSGVIQAKLNLGQPGDIYEQEADQVAKQVMRMPEPKRTGKESLSGQTQVRSIQRVCTECEEELRRDPIDEEEEMAQNRKASESTNEVTSDLESRIHTLRGRGQPLPQSSQDFFGTRFGVDFSGVQVHNDSDSDTLNQSLNARAFTVGQDIFFRKGEYDPASSSGQMLLAHELTHVGQQTVENHPGAVREKVEKKVQRQLWGPSTEHIPVSQLNYEQRLNEAFESALPAFGLELFLGIAILLISIVIISAVLSIVLGWLEAILSAVAMAFIHSALAVGTAALGVVFGYEGIRLAREAVLELNGSITSAVTHEDLDRAGEQFGRKMARAVVEVMAAVLSFLGALRIRHPGNRPVRFGRPSGSQRTRTRQTTEEPTAEPATEPPSRVPVNFRIISEEVVVYGDPPNVHEIVVVQTSSGPQPYYLRTGRGGVSGGAQPGEWAPFDGILPRPGGGLWFDKGRFVELPRDHPLHRYGTEELQRIGQWLGRQILSGVRRPIAEENWTEVNAWLRRLGVRTALGSD